MNTKEKDDDKLPFAMSLVAAGNGAYVPHSHSKEPIGVLDGIRNISHRGTLDYIVETNPPPILAADHGSELRDVFYGTSALETRYIRGDPYNTLQRLAGLISELPVLLGVLYIQTTNWHAGPVLIVGKPSERPFLCLLVENAPLASMETELYDAPEHNTQFEAVVVSEKTLERKIQLRKVAAAVHAKALESPIECGAPPIFDADDMTKRAGAHQDECALVSEGVVPYLRLKVANTTEEQFACARLLQTAIESGKYNTSELEQDMSPTENQTATRTITRFAHNLSGRYPAKETGCLRLMTVFASSINAFTKRSTTNPFRGTNAIPIGVIEKLCKTHTDELTGGAPTICHLAACILFHATHSPPYLISPQNDTIDNECIVGARYPAEQVDLCVDALSSILKNDGTLKNTLDQTPVTITLANIPALRFVMGRVCNIPSPNIDGLELQRRMHEQPKNHTENLRVTTGAIYDSIARAFGAPDPPRFSDATTLSCPRRIALEAIDAILRQTGYIPGLPNVESPSRVLVLFVRTCDGTTRVNENSILESAACLFTRLPCRSVMHMDESISFEAMLRVYKSRDVTTIAIDLHRLLDEQECCTGLVPTANLSWTAHAANAVRNAENDLMHAAKPTHVTLQHHIRGEVRDEIDRRARMMTQHQDTLEKRKKVQIDNRKNAIRRRADSRMIQIVP